MNDAFRNAVLSLQNKRYIRKELIDKFLKRLDKSELLVKSDGIKEHFCVGCKIINIEKRKMYLCYHKKSDTWMGPGGHIEKGESPLDAVLRECREEIGLQDARPVLFELTHFPKVNRGICGQHFDFGFYIDFQDTPEFLFDRGEFYDAHWMSFEDVLKKKLLPEWRSNLLNLYRLIDKGQV